MKSRNSGTPMEAVSIESVLFSMYTSCGFIASTIRSQGDPRQYQHNADNFYYSTRILWATAYPFISTAARDERKKCLHQAVKQYREIVGDNKDPLTTRNIVRINDLTVHLAFETLRLVSESLEKRGLLKERHGVATAGETTVEVLHGKIASDSTVCPDPDEGVSLDVDPV